MALAISEYNDSRSPEDPKIDVVTGDTASDKSQSIALVSKFAHDDAVLMILGPTTSVKARRRPLWRMI
jgi:ABC-type branched-subunit amino acid transport system substrate-binding protein